MAARAATQLLSPKIFCSLPHWLKDSHMDCAPATIWDYSLPTNEEILSDPEIAGVPIWRVWPQALRTRVSDIFAACIAVPTASDQRRRNLIGFANSHLLRNCCTAMDPTGDLFASCYANLIAGGTANWSNGVFSSSASCAALASAFLAMALSFHMGERPPWWKCRGIAAAYYGVDQRELVGDADAFNRLLGCLGSK